MQVLWLFIVGVHSLVFIVHVSCPCFIMGAHHCAQVLGLFIVRGRKPPPELALVLDEHEWALVRVDATDSQVIACELHARLARAAGPAHVHGRKRRAPCCRARA